MELAHGREPARRRGGLEAPRREVGKPAADIVRRGITRRLAAEEFEVIRDIALIGVERIARRAALGRQHVEEGIQTLARQPTHFGCSLEGGTISIISRWTGWTKVTSAIMPPKISPAMIPMKARKRNSVGTSGGLSQSLAVRAIRAPSLTIPDRNPPAQGRAGHSPVQSGCGPMTSA